MLTVAPGGNNLATICYKYFLGLATINMYILLLLLLRDSLDLRSSVLSLYKYIMKLSSASPYGL